MFRHGSPRDDRRRRSLLEDAAATDETGGGTKTRRSAKSVESYAQSARTEFHARWSDLVPLRNWTLAALFAAGVLVIAALEAGHFFADQSVLPAIGDLRALDLTQRDSLAGWFVALVMFSAGVLAVLLYTVRRFRLDDYRGRYRLWLWSAALWLVMSIDAIADLRSAVCVLGTELSGRTGPWEGILWWLGPAALMIAWCGARMLLDVRACRSAAASMVIGFSLLIAELALSNVSLPITSVQQSMLLSASWLVACWMILFAEVAFARHVILDAHGRLPARPVKPKRQKKASASGADDKKEGGAKTVQSNLRGRDDLTTRVDPPHTPYRAATSGIDLQKAPAQNGSASKPHLSTNQPAAKSSMSSVNAGSSARSSSQFIGGYADEDDQASHSSKLSRAERKRLRKQQRTGRDRDDD